MIGQMATTVDKGLSHTLYLQVFCQQKVSEEVCLSTPPLPFLDHRGEELPDVLDGRVLRQEVHHLGEGQGEGQGEGRGGAEERGEGQGRGGGEGLEQYMHGGRKYTDTGQCSCLEKVVARDSPPHLGCVDELVV